MGADVATGITVVFGTSGFSADITDITPPEASVESLETSHQGTTTAKTFTPADLIDWGEMRIDFHFDEDTDPPVGSAAETVTLTWPDTSTWAFSGFMTNYSGSGPLNGLMSGSATVKVTGDVTITGAGSGS